MEAASGGLDERRLRSLLEVGRQLVVELDLELLLRRVLDVARELTGARYAALGILDRERKGLERFLTSGIEADAQRAIGDLPRGRGILGELIREPSVLRLEDLSEHPRSFGFPPGHPEMHSFLGAPILIRGSAWGNLYLTEKERGPFDARDEEALVVLTEWAAIAIENARLHEHLERRREELENAVAGLEATTTIAKAVGGEIDLERVLALVVKRARALVEARSLLILLTEGEGELVVAAAAGEVGEGVTGTRIDTTGTVMGQLVSGGGAERLSDISSRVRLGLGELAANASNAMLVPLVFRGATVGVLLALDRTGGRDDFSEEDERMMRGFAGSAATAVATAQTIEADQLRLSIEAAENERGRWARELHDETLQGLGALQVLLTSALRMNSATAVEEAAREAVEQISAEIDKLQSLITELRPASLDDIGLTPALESLIERSRAVHGLSIDGTIDLDSGRRSARLEPEIESTTYRLVQEALTNVAKHARAEAVEVIVTERDGEVEVAVSDDGRGFDPERTRSGFGLVGMRERVDLAGGSLTVSSKPGAGTTIRARLPGRHLEPKTPPWKTGAA